MDGNGLQLYPVSVFGINSATVPDRQVVQDENWTEVAEEGYRKGLCQWH